MVIGSKRFAAKPFRGLAGRRAPALPVFATALLACVLVGCDLGNGMSAASAESRPRRLVQLPDGRNLNLKCSGRGAPTILLESGFGASPGAWGRVQPQLARMTRVCAYDRAGSGFSDPGPLPRDGAAIARDLDQALEAAGIEGPYIIVGHSAGGLYARLFAARRPGEVQGLVLLDPTVEQRARDTSADGLGGVRRRIQRCLAASESKPQPPREAPQWAGCIPVHADAHAVSVSQRPDTWRNQLSELDSIFGRTSEQVMRLGDLLQDIPIYVITASDTAEGAPKIGYGDLQSTWELQHLRLALSFRHGWQRTILSSHLVMIDRPEAVIEATDAMVKAARAGVSPEPLAPSETAKPPADDPLGIPFAENSPAAP
jgi:pimeloyl-ACP methyl ester carboxylesterase